MKKLVCTFFLLFWVTQVVGQTINYQGRLTNTNGNPIDETVNISLKVYDSETGGSVLYSEEVGEVKVANGLYSFSFGESGYSTVQIEEVLALTTTDQNVYNYTASFFPFVGNVKITQGENVWNSDLGDTGDDFLGNVNKSLGNITAIYKNSFPETSQLIMVNYSCEFSTINRTLKNNGHKYVEIAINGNIQAKREKLSGVPHAHTSESVNNLFKSFSAFDYSPGSYYRVDKDMVIFGEINGGTGFVEFTIKSGDPNRNRTYKHSVNKNTGGNRGGGGGDTPSKFLFLPFSAGEHFTFVISPGVIPTFTVLEF